MRLKLMTASIALWCIATPGLSQPLRHSRHNVPLYTGPRAKPVFTGEGARFANMRSRVREAFATNAIAAGHYIVLQIGCGSGCTSNIVGDLRTGRLLDFPLGGEEYQGLDILTEPKSKLFVARWSNVAFTTCTTRYYTLEGARFIQVARDSFENKSCSG